MGQCSELATMQEQLAWGSIEGEAANLSIGIVGFL